MLTPERVILSVIPGHRLFNQKQGESETTMRFSRRTLDTGEPQMHRWFAYSTISQANSTKRRHHRPWSNRGIRSYLEPSTSNEILVPSSRIQWTCSGEAKSMNPTPTTKTLSQEYGKPVKKTTDMEDKDSLSRISPRLTQLVEKYPMLLKVLAAPSSPGILERLS